MTFIDKAMANPWQNTMVLVKWEEGIPFVAPDEVGVKPHKRHRPRKKQVFTDAGGLVGILPEVTDPPAMPQSDSEGVDAADQGGICTTT